MYHHRPTGSGSERGSFMASEPTSLPNSMASLLMEESLRNRLMVDLLEIMFLTLFHLDSAWFMLASSESFSAGSSSSMTLALILTSTECLFPH